MIGKVTQGLVEGLYLLGAGAFLRTEDGRGPIAATQGVVDIGGDFQLHLCQARVQRAGIDAG
ncbi:hypothetical protein D9M71_603020 [compost metagenome]